MTVSIQAKASRVRLLLFDVDGVLTDGRILLHADGTETKRFDIRDGTAIVWAQRAGLTVGFLSARTSAATANRAAQLGVAIVSQGVASKLDAYRDILRQQTMTDRQVAYMGDDVLDLPVLARVGLPAAPSDAVKDVRERVAWISRARGGEGAARELIETVLRAQGRWDGIMREYLDQGRPGPSAPGRASAGPARGAGERTPGPASPGKRTRTPTAGARLRRSAK